MHRVGRDSASGDGSPAGEQFVEPGGMGPEQVDVPEIGEDALAVAGVAGRRGLAAVSWMPRY